MLPVLDIRITHVYDTDSETFAIVLAYCFGVLSSWKGNNKIEMAAEGRALHLLPHGELEQVTRKGEHTMKLAIGNDHVAVEMKNEIKAYLEGKSIEVIDVGTDNPDRFDYPISGYKVAKLVAAGDVDGGVLICGTGVGISLAANKVKGIRACVCSEPYSAKLSKQHNNSNIIAFGARVVGIETAKMIVDEWLSAQYEGGRHQRRVDMIAEIEETQHLAAADK